MSGWLERPTLFHLIGNPGTGKYTIACEIARLTGARLVDNHAVANVIFNLLDSDGVKPLPAAVWPQVAAVRRAVLDTLIEVSPPRLSFVFTNYLHGGSAAETAMFEEMAGVAEVRGSVFVPVLLWCDTNELVRRIVSESRRQRMKMIDPVQGARLNDEVPRFETDDPRALRLDITSLAPEDAAQRIIAHAASLPGA